MTEIICITGIDGAGKTTLARKLVDSIQEKDLPGIYIYGRTYPVFSRALMAVGRGVMLRNHDIWNDYADYSRAKKNTMRNLLFKWVYTFTIIIDYFPKIWFKLLLHYSGRRFIVLDRYIYDTVICDLAVHLNYSVPETLNAIAWGLHFLPKPRKTYLVDLPEEVAFKRKDDVPHIDFLKERRGYYLKLLSLPEIELINGEASIEDLVNSMSSTIISHNLRGFS
jgi:dTMP kinase